MADFFTHSDDEEAVKEILSQAMDMAILEQMVSINNTAYLPSHLETRFQNLKNNPSKPASLSTQSFNLSHQFNRSGCANETKKSNHSEVKNRGEQIECGKGFSQKSQEKLKSYDSWKKENKAIYTSRSFSGCFLCFLNKVSRRKSKENRDLNWRKNDDEFLSDFTSFSMKNQQKMMKKAVKEEEKIRREAEKIVKRIQHASALVQRDI